MNKNTVKFRINPEGNIVNHPLDEIVRNGAKEMLQRALEIEVDLFLEKYQYILEQCENEQAVVKNERFKRPLRLEGNTYFIDQPDSAYNDFDDISRIVDMGRRIP